MNYTVYNMDSEQRNLERLCAFPMLTLQTKEHDVNVNIGADSLLVYGGDYDGSISAPSWISPSEGILRTMNDLSNEVVQKLVESANVLGATAISTGNQAKSGVALQFEFLGQQFALKQNARTAEAYEMTVSFMVGMFIGENVEYKVIYRDTYAPSQDELTKKIAIIEKMIDMDISSRVTAELKKELIKDIANYYNFDIEGKELAESVADEDLL
jgi:hypothetical protein